MGGDAVAGGADVGEVGSHLAVDGDRTLDAKFGAAVGSKVRVGANAD